MRMESLYPQGSFSTSVRGIMKVAKYGQKDEGFEGS